MLRPKIELFRGLVPEKTLREGVQTDKDHRVKCVELCGGELIGFVEEDASWNVAKTEVRVYADGHVAGRCTCGFEARPCPHVIATVLAAADGPIPIEIESEAALPSKEEAIKEVIRAARRVVAVDPIAADERGYGVWKAQVMAKHRPSASIERVEIYSLQSRANQCTCREFRFDQLGTCRHIEAVLHALDTERDEPPRSVLYADWTGDEPVVRALWSVRHQDAPPRRLAALLDDEGQLSGPLETLVQAIGRDRRRVRGVEIGAGVLHLLERAEAEVERRARPIRVVEAMRRTPSTGTFNGMLRPFQEKGVEFLVRHGRAVLADEMGLGKTVQAIAAADRMIHMGEVERVLVICPASIKYQWLREIQRFTDHPAEVVSGDARQRSAMYRRAPRILVANYELVMRDSSFVRSAFGPDLLIVDEAQRVKNRETLTAETVKSLNARFCFALTGTPVENDGDDLFSIMELVDPTVLGPFWAFEGTPSSQIHLAASPYILRRRREILADQLPPRTVEQRIVKISKDQLDYQRRKVAAAKKLLKEAQRMKRPLTPGEHNLLMGFLTQARMASNSLFLVDGETRKSAKVDALMSLLQELQAEGRKVVVFSEWIKMIELVREELNERGVRSLFLHGGIPSTKRPNLISQFADSPDIPVFFSTEAGGVGLNLQMASAIVNIELPWNPAKLDQRVARVHRLGQDRDVRVIHLVGTGYEEMQLLPLLQRKRSLSRSLLEPNAQHVERIPARRELGYSALSDGA